MDVTPRWISIVRHHARELTAVLLAGVGLGVGLAALLVGHSGGEKSRHVVRSARTQPALTPPPGRPRGPATAGVQPGRQESQLSIESQGQTSAGESTASRDGAPALDAGAKASFARLAAGLPGRVELAVAPVGAGTAVTLGGDMPAHGWSTTKVPVLTALLAARGESLSPQERSWAASAITASNNESILELFHDLERIEGGLIGASSYVQELLRRSGDEETTVATAPPPAGAVTTFGQTKWKPSNAVKFFNALARGCLLSPQGTGYVLELMRHVEPSESWGLGSGGFARIAFKGGWGPESGGVYIVRQAGIVDVGSSRAVTVAIIAFPPAGAGSFEVGTAMLTETATWLHGHLRLVPRSSVACA
jgi:Beta-lactamase enzyme family